MNIKLSKNQELILKSIKTFLKEKGYSPTIREICLDTGIKSTSTVHSNLKKLSDLNIIDISDNISRSIKLINNYNENNNDLINKILNKKNDFFKVPILGEVAAGNPIMAIQDYDEYFPLPNYMKKRGDIFMLNVNGESMINIGIYDGDKIIVRRQSTANPGDIIVAIIDNEDVTVKTFYKKNNKLFKPNYTNFLRILQDYK